MPCTASREETRIIEYFTPDYDKLIKVAEPDESKLHEFYEQNKRQYMALGAAQGQRAAADARGGHGAHDGDG